MVMVDTESVQKAVDYFNSGEVWYFTPFRPMMERSGSVVECLTRDLGAAGLSLTDFTALWSLSKTHLS